MDSDSNKLEDFLPNLAAKKASIKVKNKQAIQEIQVMLQEVVQQNSKLKEIKNALKSTEELTEQKTNELKSLDSQIENAHQSLEHLALILTNKKEENELCLQMKEDSMKEIERILSRYRELTSTQKDLYNQRPLVQKMVALKDQIESNRITIDVLKRENEILRQNCKDLHEIGINRFQQKVVELAETVRSRDQTYKECDSLFEEIKELEISCQKLTIEYDKKMELKQIAVVQPTNKPVTAQNEEEIQRLRIAHRYRRNSLYGEANSKLPGSNSVHIQLLKKCFQHTIRETQNQMVPKQNIPELQNIEANRTDDTSIPQECESSNMQPSPNNDIRRDAINLRKNLDDSADPPDIINTSVLNGQQQTPHFSNQKGQTTDHRAGRPATPQNNYPQLSTTQINELALLSASPTAREMRQSASPIPVCVVVSPFHENRNQTVKQAQVDGDRQYDYQTRNSNTDGQSVSNQSVDAYRDRNERASMQSTSSDQYIRQSGRDVPIFDAINHTNVQRYAHPPLENPHDQSVIASRIGSPFASAPRHVLPSVQYQYDQNVNTRSLKSPFGSAQTYVQSSGPDQKYHTITTTRIQSPYESQSQYNQIILNDASGYTNVQRYTQPTIQNLQDQLVTSPRIKSSFGSPSHHRRTMHTSELYDTGTKNDTNSPSFGQSPQHCQYRTAQRFIPISVENNQYINTQTYTQSPGPEMQSSSMNENQYKQRFTPLSDQSVKRSVNSSFELVDDASLSSHHTDNIDIYSHSQSFVNSDNAADENRSNKKIDKETEPKHLNDPYLSQYFHKPEVSPRMNQIHSRNMRNTVYSATKVNEVNQESITCTTDLECDQPDKTLSKNYDEAYSTNSGAKDQSSVLKRPNPDTEITDRLRTKLSKIDPDLEKRQDYDGQSYDIPDYYSIRAAHHELKTSSTFGVDENQQNFDSGKRVEALNSSDGSGFVTKEQGSENTQAIPSENTKFDREAKSDIENNENSVNEKESSYTRNINEFHTSSYTTRSLAGSPFFEDNPNLYRNIHSSSITDQYSVAGSILSPMCNFGSPSSRNGGDDLFGLESSTDNMFAKSANDGGGNGFWSFGGNSPEAAKSSRLF